ncbi:unnamed protein product [Dibothriocephalus latus]|uniref:Uncharacterized protein n=1 Tax=Dibothriocephalus latus TaxID=60516 RepID=A0A3P7QT62_DIBLA|nr:unnamed protein product [Dibothriocephalus latus]
MTSSTTLTLSAVVTSPIPRKSPTLASGLPRSTATRPSPIRLLVLSMIWLLFANSPGRSSMDWSPAGWLA